MNALALFIVTGCYSGLLTKKGQGTIGSIAAVLAWLFLSRTGILDNHLITALCLSLVTVLGVLSINIVLSPLTQTSTKQDKDPGKIVIDEWAGMWITLAFHPLTVPVVLVGFFLFRLLDITKPGPIRAAENLPRGWGVMGDDVLAGVVASFILSGVLFLFPALHAP